MTDMSDLTHLDPVRAKDVDPEAEAVEEAEAMGAVWDDEAGAWRDPSQVSR